MMRKREYCQKTVGGFSNHDDTVVSQELPKGGLFT